MMMRNLLFMIITILLPPHDDDKKPPLGKGARQAQPLLPSALLPRWICDKNVGHWEKRRLWGWQQFMMHLIFYPSAFRSNTLKTSLIFSFAFILKWEYVTDLYVNLNHPAIDNFKGHSKYSRYRSPISHHVKELVQLDGSILILKLWHGHLGSDHNLLLFQHKEMGKKVYQSRSQICSSTQIFDMKVFCFLLDY